MPHLALFNSLQENNQYYAACWPSAHAGDILRIIKLSCGLQAAHYLVCLSAKNALQKSSYGNRAEVGILVVPRKTLPMEGAGGVMKWCTNIWTCVEYSNLCISKVLHNSTVLRIFICRRVSTYMKNYKQHH